MAGYIFRPPAAAADLKFTYEALAAFVQRGRSGSSRKLGSTLEITHHYAGQISVLLYGTKIAELLSNGTVAIPDHVNEYGSQATTYWLQKVLTDNRISGLVGRQHGRYSQAGQAYFRQLPEHTTEEQAS
jgi:hypothetical protein